MRATRVLCWMVIMAVIGDASAVRAGPIGAKKPSELVVVKVTGVGDCGGIVNASYFDTRVVSDGTTTTFTILPGSVFVATEVAMQMMGAPGAAVAPRLMLGDAGSATTVDEYRGTLDANGYLSMKFTFPSGLPVKAGKSLCAANAAFSGATANGYLAKDR